MIDFAKLKSLTITEGNVVQVEVDGVTIWNATRYRYVSFGDSIAAGHTINGDWAEDYGEKSQYGVNGNTSTVIVPNSYTDLIRRDLEALYGQSGVSTVSFARSGDTVADLLDKLTHDNVRRVISKANMVTICIGANDVLQPAMSGLGGYINTGNIDDLAKDVDAHLAILNDDAASTSYKALFDRFVEINPKAQYVFTTVYNPYKYLWLDESTSGNDYKDGFLGPLMWAVPDSLGSLANLIRKAFCETAKVRDTFNRINSIGSIAEGFITRLNAILRAKISQYGNPNFVLADTKAVFDPVPDRLIPAPIHYNDLVSVEPTRGYVVEDLDWGQFWGNVNWSDVINNIDNIANTVMNNVIENVIIPDVDPHPEKDGHEYLSRAFKDVLGLESLDRYTITYNANGGSGSMSERVVTSIHGRTAYVNIDTLGFTRTDAGWYFTGWNTRQDGTGTAYSAGQFIGINSDITLYAQWSNLYTLTYTHSQGDVIQFDSGQTGPMECYELWVAGTANNNAGKPEDKLGAFSNPAKTYTLPYGTAFGVVVRTASGSGRSYIQKGSEKWGSAKSVSHDFTLTGNTTVNFEWNQWLSGFTMQSYWNCYITTN